MIKKLYEVAMAAIEADDSVKVAIPLTVISGRYKANSMIVVGQDDAKYRVDVNVKPFVDEQPEEKPAKK